MLGPIEGRRHDDIMLGVSGLADKLSRFQTPTGEPYVLYMGTLPMVWQTTSLDHLVEPILMMMNKHSTQK